MWSSVGMEGRNPLLRLAPTACFTCGHIVGNVVATYHRLRDEGVPPEVIATSLGLTRDCCRMVVSQAAINIRLIPPIPSTQTFADIRFLPKDMFPEVTLPADGESNPVPGPPK
jgi:DNA-directed RNA polymerase subunit N (RpoN/RPB10)